MGLYRLFLAVLVAISHVGIRFYGYNPGLVAVISFFLLSGYVMTVLIEKHYKQPSAIPTFYLDRAARLFPQFMFYMVLAFICIYFFKINTPNTNLLSFSKWLLNFLILPLGYFMYWESNGALVIPQAWSLGLEMTFYMVIPWILVYCSKRQIFGLAGISFLVFLAAYLGMINTNYFGLRLLPGTLFMFLTGSAFFENDIYSRKFRAIIFLLAGSLLVIAFFNKQLYQLPYSKDVLVGLLVGILAINFLRHVNFSSIDEFFGNLSYGVFLNNFIVIWIMQRFFAVNKFGATHVVILLLASCVLALCSFFFVERPALRWRHAIRYGTKQSQPKLPVKQTTQ